jgi:hypothetical protein
MSTLKKDMDGIVGLAAGGLVVAGLIGYALNLWKIAEALGSPFTGVVLLRVVGVFFAPLGAVLGWF